MKALKDLLCASMTGSSVNEPVQSELERKAREADGVSSVIGSHFLENAQGGTRQNKDIEISTTPLLCNTNGDDTFNVFNCQVKGCIIDSRKSLLGTATGYNFSACCAPVHELCCQRSLGIVAHDNETPLFCTNCTMKKEIR